MTKILVLLSIISFFASLSACKQSSNEQKETETKIQAKTQEAIVSVAQPEIQKIVPETKEVIIPQEEILIDDSASDEKTVEVTEKDFGCIRDMQQVRGMYVGNLLGNIDATEAVANSQEGGVYPPGTVVQLVPGEAMVKREKGFNTATNDWEFFVLNVSPKGTQIASRGGEEVKTAFGQDCLSCHAQAKPQWDMICETGHGCAPIPITRDMIVALQKTDQRCTSMELEPADKEALVNLEKLIAGFQAQAAAAKAAATASEAVEGVPEEVTDEATIAPVAEGEASHE
ncbi:hypothetical protein VU04_04210 [Desulfobulbus sp. TB]|nr:hypothetical protein [Desulfobulbus sp. TB]